MVTAAPVGKIALMSSIWTIRRSTSDAKLAGVCGGVAEHWNVDPLLVRIGCVLLALSGGIGLVLYVAGWLLIPVDGSEKPVVADVLGESAGRISREMWLVIVVIACIVSFAVLGSTTPFGFGPALILALIWYFGYYRPKLGKNSAATKSPGRAADPARRSGGPADPVLYLLRAADRVHQGRRRLAGSDRPGAAGYGRAAVPGAKFDVPRLHGADFHGTEFAGGADAGPAAEPELGRRAGGPQRTGRVGPASRTQ